MTHHEAILLYLCIASILLIILRVTLHYQTKTGVGIDVGKSMTIGNREMQEDNFITIGSSHGTLAVLADGMGEAVGGRIASRIAVDTFSELFEDYHSFDHPQYYFKKAFNAANRGILRALDNEQRGAASVGCAIILDGKLYYAVVGNVKVCILRGKDLIPLTEGHTLDVLAQKEFRQGNITRQDALALLVNHRLYNYLGQDGFHEVELFDKPVTLQHEDMVVLMSDGVYEVLPWRSVEDILSTKADCQMKAYQVIEAINRNEAADKDNASIILIRV